jgi:hypothetical protein
MDNKMTNKKIIGLFATTALFASLSSVANSQITISGYVESSYMTGSSKSAAGVPGSQIVKQLGNETLIKVSSKGKLSNGMDYNVFQDFESDESHVMHGRLIEISPMAGINVGYSFDATKGSEIARTATPYVTSRHTDVTGLTGITEPLDVTSSEHFVYLDIVNKLGDKSQLSFAYAPNLDSASNNGSDRIITVTHNNSGYGIGYKVTPIAGLTAAVGVTRIEQNNPTQQDVDMRTYGITFANGPFAIGAQRYRQDGLKTPQVASHRDETTLISATFAVTKEFTIGVGFAEQERTLAGTRTAVDANSRLFSIGYNLGPVALTYDLERNENIPGSATTAPTSGRDNEIHKVRVRAAF